MNDLFEAYIAVLMRRSLRPGGFTVETQGGRLFCLIEEGDQGRRRFQTRPDIIVRDRQSNAPIAIVDTKWKRLSPAIEDVKHGVNQTDVYQMMAYGQIYSCPNLILIYPHHLDLGSGPFSTDYLVNGNTDRLHLRSVDVAQREVGIMANLAAIFQRWKP